MNCNINGGVYVRGRVYSIETRYNIINTYNKLKLIRGGEGEPTHEEIAQEAMVSKSFVTKIMKEYNENGFLIDPR